MEISFEIENIEIPDFNPEFFISWINIVIAHYEVKFEQLDYMFVSDEAMLEINRNVLNHDYYTDIITFNYNEKYSLSGEIVISVDRVKENAKSFGNGNFWDEFCRVVIHGVLHLIGYNDKTESEEIEMRRQEDICLELRKNVSRETSF